MRVTPSSILGLTQGSYEAYCLDQAAWFLGSVITEELNKVGHKRQKGEAQNEAGRKRVLQKYLHDGTPQPQQYADPALLFS